MFMFIKGDKDMDMLWFVIAMLTYGFVIGLIIGIGALCYAFISTYFEERTLKRKHGPKKLEFPFSHKGIGKGIGTR